MQTSSCYEQSSGNCVLWECDSGGWFPTQGQCNSGYEDPFDDSTLCSEGDRHVSWCVEENILMAYKRARRKFLKKAREIAKMRGEIGTLAQAFIDAEDELQRHSKPGNCGGQNPTQQS